MRIVVQRVLSADVTVDNIQISKIESISSIYGGRGSILLINGETVIASRNYYHHVVSKIKQEA